MSHCYWVDSTKKGGLPLSLERRKYGKPVTLLSQCVGDVPALLARLKSALGTGGKMSSDGRAIELQGDLLLPLEEWLRREGCVRGLAKPREVKASQEDLPPSSREPRAKPRWSDERVRAAQERAMPHALGIACEPYRGFCELMRSWCYWDQDWSRLPELWALHQAGSTEPGEMGELEPPAGCAQAITTITPGPGARDGVRSLDEALRELGMVAEPCPTRQKRAERLAAARSRREAEAASATTATARTHTSLGSSRTANAPAVLPTPAWAESRPGCLDVAAARRLVVGSLGRGRLLIAPEAGRQQGGARSGGGRSRIVGRACGLGGRGRVRARKPRLGTLRDGDGCSDDEPWGDSADDMGGEETQDASRASAGMSLTGERTGRVYDLTKLYPLPRKGEDDEKPSLLRSRGHIRGATSTTGFSGSSAGHAPGSGFGHGVAGANVRDEEAQLQLALKLSLLDTCGGSPASLDEHARDSSQHHEEPLDALAALEERLEAQRKDWVRQMGAGSGRRPGGPLHLSCKEVWGDLDEDEALALAIRLSAEEAGAKALEVEGEECLFDAAVLNDSPNGKGSGSDGGWAIAYSDDAFSLPSGDEELEQTMMDLSDAPSGEPPSANARGREIFANTGKGPELKERSATAPNQGVEANGYNLGMDEDEAFELALALSSRGGGGSRLEGVQVALSTSAGRGVGHMDATSQDDVATAERPAPRGRGRGRRLAAFSGGLATPLRDSRVVFTHATGGHVREEQASGAGERSKRDDLVRTLEELVEVKGQIGADGETVLDFLERLPADADVHEYLIDWLGQDAAYAANEVCIWRRRGR